ncbi:hypothetical protein ACJRO7_015495 [Eucalyptus globulus]|uniref:PNPLA domain-containing protein n=1 Tax=Eucalyptus globulus TaxID=34317 RepID=A0ABD3L9P7_EUCGL
MTQAAVHEIRHLQWMLRHLTSHPTFQEAYDMTGRVLGITVCSPRKHEPLRRLNYLTSPHVVIWSAVTASCAFPGLFEAQELMAKDRSGEIVLYHPPFNLEPEEGLGPSMRRWRDGSLEIDLPMIQLKELFNVNHFIVSQANPHIAPLLRLKELVRAHGGNFVAKMEVKHRCNQVLELGFPLGGIWVAHSYTSPYGRYSKILQNLSVVELQKAVNQGRRCTWEKLSAIKANCGIDLLSMNVAERAAAASLHGLANPAWFNASRRIPSWNGLARKNSTGSLEEYIFNDVTSSLHPHGGGFHASRGLSGRNIRVHRHDESNNESENVDLNPWTSSGGSLMRTASANKFIDYVQNLDINVELKMLPSSNSINAQMGRDLFSSEGMEFDQKDLGTRNSSSITVNEGDLLHAKRVPDGFVLNVVRREDLASPNRSGDCNCEVPECLQLDSPEKEMDVSSASESGQ